MSSEAERTTHYRKDPESERILAALNERLAGLERELVACFERPRYPIIFIVGAPRSGTTLLLQLLLAKFELGYITNTIARFWMAPFIGTVLASQIVRGPGEPLSALASEFGATAGFEGPHEFGYFWRRWFRYGETHDAGDTEVQVAESTLLARELAAVESVFDRPLVLKNPVVSFYVAFLAEALPEAVFIHCRREPVYAAQSILWSRMAFHGNRDAWFSVKPAEYKRLRNMAWPEQIAGQIHYTREAISRQSRSLAPERWLELDYESLCRSTDSELERIGAWVAENGHALRQRDFRPPKLAATNRRHIAGEEFEALRRACDAYFSPALSRGKRP